MYGGSCATNQDQSKPQSGPIQTTELSTWVQTIYHQIKSQQTFLVKSRT